MPESHTHGEAGLAEGPALAFRRHLGEGRLVFQRCASCARAIFYPRVLCPGCGSTELAWVESAGTGTVYSTTTVCPRDGEPYNVSLVDMDEGFRMLTRVERIDPERVEIGMHVRLCVSRNGEDASLTVFEPCGSED